MIAKTLSTSEKRARLHEVAGKLAEFCQALYPLLIAHSDDSGRQQGDVFTVKHAVDPSSPRPLSDFEKALGALSKVGLIQWYAVDARKFIQIHDFATHQPGLKDRGNSKIPAMPQDAVECREMPLEQNRTEQKGTEGKGTEGAVAGAALSVVSPEPDPAAPECKVEALVLKWNQTVTAPIPQCRGLSEQRKVHARARLKDTLLADLMHAIDNIEASSFCHGQNDRRWKPDFGWLMESRDNVLKVLEGKYDDRAGPVSSSPKTAGNIAALQNFVNRGRVS